ncbi:MULTISPECIES: hypothetical protein [Luteibacter]|uniref:hypothetical protein n=1 Tax=Luteibacter TaxID=242605 RepID=UPI0012E05C84|nr:MULTISPECIES: hypothetical protein [unclassified Luteibacter]
MTDKGRASPSMKSVLSEVQAVGERSSRLDITQLLAVFPSLSPPAESTKVNGRGKWVGQGFVMQDNTKVVTVDADVLADGTVVSADLVLAPEPCFDQSKVDALYTGLLDTESNANVPPDMESMYRIHRTPRVESFFGTGALHRGCVTRVGFRFIPAA